MGQRSDLQAIFKALTPHVYFQPPESFQMEYDCIVYRRDRESVRYADNALYKRMKRYEVTVISKSPDSPLPDLVAKLPLCSFDRFFTSDKLNHDVFNLYF